MKTKSHRKHRIHGFVTKALYNSEIETHSNEQYVSFSQLFEIDAKLRKRFCIRPRSGIRAFHSVCNRKKINRTHTPSGFVLWDADHFYNIFSEMYESHEGHKCSHITKASRERAHLIATPTIKADPNYLPRKQAAETAGVNPKRISGWVTHFKLFPYYDCETKQLLYPVDKIKVLAPWRAMKWLRKKLSQERCKEIQENAEKKLIILDVVESYYIYYVPELSHL